MTALARWNGSSARPRLPMTAAALRYLGRAIGAAEERTANRDYSVESLDAEATTLEMRRLRLMIDAASSAVIVVADGAAIVGMDVVVRDDGRLETYTIVPPGMGAGTQYEVSADSPFGRALLGQRASDRVIVKAPGGERLVEIVEVR